MKNNKVLLIGSTLIVIVNVISQSLSLFADHSLARIGLTSDLKACLFWAIMFAITLSVVYYSENTRVAKGWLLVLLNSIASPLIGLILSELSNSGDFRGISGLKVTIPIIFVLSVLFMGLGILVGILLPMRSKVDDL